MKPYEEKRLEWPPPRADPEREPSHRGAEFNGADYGWWQRWLEEHEHKVDHGADA